MVPGRFVGRYGVDRLKVVATESEEVDQGVATVVDLVQVDLRLSVRRVAVLCQLVWAAVFGFASSSRRLLCE